MFGFVFAYKINPFVKKTKKQLFSLAFACCSFWRYKAVFDVFALYKIRLGIRLL
jgi:hypothetical protein